jgi:hypothetical protein
VGVLSKQRSKRANAYSEVLLLLVDHVERYTLRVKGLDFLLLPLLLHLLRIDPVVLLFFFDQNLQCERKIVAKFWGEMNDETNHRVVETNPW